MFQIATTIAKYVSVPVLLMVALSSRYAGSYELLVDVVVCLGATILVRRMVWLEQYFWAAGFAAVAVVASPLLLMVKIFFLLGFTCIATSVCVLVAFRAQPLPALRP